MPTIQLYLKENKYQALSALAIHEQKTVKELILKTLEDLLEREGVTE